MTSRGTGIPEGPNAECESAIPLSCIKVPKRQTIRAVNESFCRQWLSGSEFRLDRLPRSLGPKLPPRNEHAALHPSVLSPPPHRTRGSHFHTRGGEAPKLANGCANGNTSGCRAIRNGSPSFGPRWEDPSWNPSKFSANVQRAATCSVMRQWWSARRHTQTTLVEFYAEWIARNRTRAYGKATDKPPRGSPSGPERIVVGIKEEGTLFAALRTSRKVPPAVRAVSWISRASPQRRGLRSVLVAALACLSLAEPDNQSPDLRLPHQSISSESPWAPVPFCFAFFVFHFVSFRSAPLRRKISAFSLSYAEFLSTRTRR